MILPLILAAWIGWAAGAAVNYLADFLPRKSFSLAPACPKCGQRLGLINYLIWPRTCPNCGLGRGWRAVIVEISAAIAGILLWLAPVPKLGFGLSVLLLAYLGLVTIIDLEHRLILHTVSVAGIIVGLATGISLHDPLATLTGGVAGFAIMLGLYFAGAALIRGFRRWRGLSIEDGEALGFGDVNLGGVLGLILGWPGILLGLETAILLGGMISLVYLVVMKAAGRYRADLALPYGPFMTLSVVLLLYSKAILAKL
jgi:prepilin signal peptidase PulO-like enzyme (type II secretory pathway)